MKRTALLTAVLSVVMLLAMSSGALAAQPHFSTNASGTLSPVIWWNGTEYVEIPGTVEVDIKARSIGDFIAYHDGWDDPMWEYKAAGVVKAVVDVTFDGVDLDTTIVGRVKRVYASPHTDMYSLDCDVKGQHFGVYVSLNADPPRVWLQFLAPYIGTLGQAGWSYGALPVAAGDFSFTYNH